VEGGETPGQWWTFECQKKKEGWVGWIRPWEVVRVLEQQLLGAEWWEDGLLHVGAGCAEGLDEWHVARVAQLSQHVGCEVAQARVGQLGQIREVFVHGKNAEATALGVGRNSWRSGR